jgi:dTDP-4-dehydrorhamnose reductase
MTRVAVRGANRHAGARLDTERVSSVYGLELPNWRLSLATCRAQLIPVTQETQ